VGLCTIWRFLYDDYLASYCAKYHPPHDATDHHGIKVSAGRGSPTYSNPNFSTKQRNNKTMSNTPETDSLLKINIPELFDLCRKMEQERNEARDTKLANAIHSCHNECARPMCVLRRERDEARKDVRDLMEQYQDHLRYGDEFQDSELIRGICDALTEWETKPNA
jgi:hypothetical protein